jgi:hypothetical protein
MDPRVNPYAPGAGTPPPELAGRDAVLADARLAIQHLFGQRREHRTNAIRIEHSAGFRVDQAQVLAQRELPNTHLLLDFRAQLACSLLVGAEGRVH